MKTRMDIDQDQWMAIVVAALVLACGIGGLFYHFITRDRNSIYELEEDPEA
jgi:hypothetical protein